MGLLSQQASADKRLEAAEKERAGRREDMKMLLAIVDMLLDIGEPEAVVKSAWPWAKAEVLRTLLRTVDDDTNKSLETETAESLERIKSRLVEVRHGQLGMRREGDGAVTQHRLRMLVPQNYDPTSSAHLRAEPTAETTSPCPTVAQMMHTPRRKDTLQRSSFVQVGKALMYSQEQERKSTALAAKRSSSVPGHGYGKPVAVQDALAASGQKSAAIDSENVEERRRQWTESWTSGIEDLFTVAKRMAALEIVGPKHSRALGNEARFGDVLPVLVSFLERVHVSPSSLQAAWRACVWQRTRHPDSATRLRRIQQSRVESCMASSMQSVHQMVLPRNCRAATGSSSSPMASGSRTPSSCPVPSPCSASTSRD